MSRVPCKRVVGSELNKYLLSTSYRKTNDRHIECQCTSGWRRVQNPVAPSLCCHRGRFTSRATLATASSITNHADYRNLNKCCAEESSSVPKRLHNRGRGILSEANEDSETNCNDRTDCIASSHRLRMVSN